MQKKYLTLLLLFFSVGLLKAQTVPDFTLNDCSGAKTNLYTMLNAGKVCVLIYEHRCASCNAGAKYVRDAINTNFGNNPNIQVIYLDNGGATCSQVQSWIDQGGLLNAPIIQYSSDYNSPYGTGMPVIVIAGGPAHKKYLQANGYNKTSVDGIKTALSQAIADLPADVQPAEQTNIKATILNQEIHISGIGDLNLNTIALYSLRGELIKEVPVGVGSDQLDIPVAFLSAGTYMLKFTSGSKTYVQKIILE